MIDWINLFSLIAHFFPNAVILSWHPKVQLNTQRELHQLRMFSAKCSPLGRAGPTAAPPPFIDNSANRKDSIYKRSKW